MDYTFFKDRYRQHKVCITGVLWKVGIVTYAIFLSVYSKAIAQSAAGPKPIVLRATPLSFTPTEFYISNVIDERENRKVVAYLLSATNNLIQPSITHSVDLSGGGLHAIRRFVKQSLPRNTGLRPIIIRLKECLITESPAANGRVDGRVVVSMDFELQRDSDTVHLVEYEGGGAQYNRHIGQYTAVEQALRQSLGSALQFFNTWINREVAGNEKLATGIKVIFRDYVQNVEDDTVFYAANRPLIWDDFREKPRLSRYAASVFPSFSYEGNSKIVKGTVHLNLTLKVYVLKNASWVRDAARDAYGLNHEQRHLILLKLLLNVLSRKYTLIA
jgi:hypothetical protein